MSTSLKWPSASVEARLDTEDGTVALTYASLPVEDIISSVGDDRAGATAVFVGTTRNSFKGALASKLSEILTSLTSRRQSSHPAGLPGLQSVGGQDHVEHPRRCAPTYLSFCALSGGKGSTDAH